MSVVEPEIPIWALLFKGPCWEPFLKDLIGKREVLLQRGEERRGGYLARGQFNNPFLEAPGALGGPVGSPLGSLSVLFEIE